MKDLILLALLIAGFWVCAAGAIGSSLPLVAVGWLAIVAGGVLAAS